jgi:hypothetical protein
VDGLTAAPSLLIVDAKLRGLLVAALAQRWLVTSIMAKVAQGLGHGPVGAMVSA